MILKRLEGIKRHEQKLKAVCSRKEMKRRRQNTHIHRLTKFICIRMLIFWFSISTEEFGRKDLQSSLYKWV